MKVLIKKKNTIDPSIPQTPLDQRVVETNLDPGPSIPLTKIKSDSDISKRKLIFKSSDSESDDSIIIDHLFDLIPPKTENKDIIKDNIPIMAQFSIADFNRVIPEFKGDTIQLPIFIKRCDAYRSTLDEPGKVSFLSHLIFKLSGKAFSIFDDKKYDDWPNLKADLL